MELQEYQNRFKFINFKRENGILEMTIHHKGDSARWAAAEGFLHTELPRAFYCVNQDPENHVVILAGTGDCFLADWVPDDEAPFSAMTPAIWHRIYREGSDLLNRMLDIEVPMIAAVNGNCFIHPELPTMCDLVISSDKAAFADKAHIAGTGTVPADGSHIWWPMLLGPNRGRSFLLLGEEISATEGKSLGFVTETVPQSQVLQRAWEHAKALRKLNPIVLRNTRISLVQHIKRRFHDDLGYGLQLEGMGVLSKMLSSSKGAGTA